MTYDASFGPGRPSAHELWREGWRSEGAPSVSQLPLQEQETLSKEEIEKVVERAKAAELDEALIRPLCALGRVEIGMRKNFFFETRDAFTHRTTRFTYNGLMGRMGVVIIDEKPSILVGENEIVRIEDIEVDEVAYTPKWPSGVVMKANITGVKHGESGDIFHVVSLTGRYRAVKRHGSPAHA